MEGSIKATEVKELREATGVGMMDCKKALVEHDGNFDAALESLRKRGQAKADKRGDREAKEGITASYLHANGQIGVLVEINCETDFVARNADFQEFADDVALHIAAAAPDYLNEEDVPKEVIEREMEGFHIQVPSTAPDNVVEQIVQGKFDKWLDGNVLMRQPHVNSAKHNNKSIEEIRVDLSAKLGENIIVRRYSRFHVGH